MIIYLKYHLDFLLLTILNHFLNIDITNNLMPCYYNFKYLTILKNKSFIENGLQCPNDYIIVFSKDDISDVKTNLVNYATRYYIANLRENNKE